MCRAKDLIDELKEVSDQINKEFYKLSNLVSKYDKELSRMYHKLEQKQKMNASEGYLIARDLRDLLQKRRIVKQELDYYKSVRNTLDIKKMYANLNKAEQNIDNLQKRHEDYRKGWKVDIEDVLV